MSEETNKTLNELRTILLVIMLFIFVASLMISVYSKMGMVEAFETVVMQILQAGTGGMLGNILYVVIIFLILGVTFYMFEKVIILLSQISLGKMFMQASLSSIKDHYIVCGAGRVGTYTAEKLKKEKQRVVVIEKDCKEIQRMEKEGYIVVEGDCMNEDVLLKAKIKKAKGILACTGEDHKNVFIVLTAKDLNPSIKVATRVNDHDALNEFQRAGADIIVAPEITGGYELADKILSKK
jgi:voltage-gated potassium channel